MIEYAKKIHKRDLTEKEIDECKFIDTMTKTSSSGCFVMSYTQFDILTKLCLYPKSKKCPGMWKLQLHPKNAFIRTCDLYEIIQMKLPFMSASVPYFRMIFGPAFPITWCNIAEQINSLGTNNKPLFVAFCFDNDQYFEQTSKHWIHYFDKLNDAKHSEQIFCGGGRVYCDRVAVPCDISHQFTDDNHSNDRYTDKLTYNKYNRNYTNVYLKDEHNGIYVCDIFWFHDDDKKQEKKMLKELNTNYGLKFLTN